MHRLTCHGSLPNKSDRSGGASTSATTLLSQPTGERCFPDSWRGAGRTRRRSSRRAGVGTGMERYARASGQGKRSVLQPLVVRRPGLRVAIPVQGRVFRLNARFDGVEEGEADVSS